MIQIVKAKNLIAVHCANTENGVEDNIELDLGIGAKESKNKAMVLPL